MKVELRRINKSCHFEASNEEGLNMQIDSSKEFLGEGAGIRPMQSLLMALGGCTGIDVALILAKQRLVAKDFRIVVEGKREDNKDVALWKKIHIQYILQGDLHEDKVHRAVELSLNKYCSVAETLRRAGAIISFEITLSEG